MADLLSKDVWLVVLGAVLALMVSFIIELAKGKIADGRMTNHLRSLLKHEIANLNDLIQKLIDDTVARGFIPFTELIAIQIARQGYDRNRDWSILLQIETRDALFDFYGRLNIATSEAQTLEGSVQAYLSTPGGPAQMASERQRLLATFRDLLNAGRLISTRLANS